MADVTYNIQDESAFDGMVEKLGGMSEQQQQLFAVLLQGYQAGVQVGIRTTASKSNKEENHSA